MTLSPGTMVVALPEVTGSSIEASKSLPARSIEVRLYRKVGSYGLLGLGRGLWRDGGYLY